METGKVIRGVKSPVKVIKEKQHGKAEKDGDIPDLQARSAEALRLPFFGAGVSGSSCGYDENS